MLFDELLFFIALFFKADLVLSEHLGLGSGAQRLFFGVSKPFYNPGNLFIEGSNGAVLRLLIGPNVGLIGLNLLENLFEPNELGFERLFVIRILAPGQAAQSREEKAQHPMRARCFGVHQGLSALSA